MSNVVLKPVITEKSTDLQEKLKRYIFVVEKSANKIQIKQEVEQLYGVTVEAVNTVIVRGKSKTRLTKAGAITGKSASYKKAFITLAEGEEIDFYANI